MYVLDSNSEGGKTICPEAKVEQEMDVKKNQFEG
jgi:hypothetical protein